MSTNKIHKYEYEVDVTSNTAAAYVAAMVGREKQVLEIGPGPGSITKVLQSINICRVTAIELDGEAIEKLIPYCDRIIQADLNSIDWQKLLVDIGRFEVVVAADVLEHLYDPWAALRGIVQFLSPDGYVVVSLPHIGHGAVMSCLLNDNFEYREWGLLDRTHIRFFGLKNIEELFAQAGLKIIEACYVLKAPEETEFASDWSRLSGPVQDLIMNNPHAQVYQVVVKAVLANHEGKPVSLIAPQREFKRRLSRQSDVPKKINETIRHAVRKSHMEPVTTAPSSSNHLNLRLIAFFLPQFHPIPENDQWWGRGFTEWTNVTKAEPLFEGHLQPHLPTDLGFYDLRLRETRREQIRMAKEYGIDAFCYHYYWFSGKRLLNFPIDDMLADPESDMPFCLCWANENWTRRWDAAEDEILIAQDYLPDDDISFIKSLQPFFEDKRYLRVDNKPFLIVYRPQHLQDPAKTASTWRNYCRQIGIGEIHLCAALTHGNESYSQFAFDSGVEFPPHNFRSGTINHLVRAYNTFHGTITQYAAVAESYLARSYDEPRVFKTVFPSWDNTARTKDRAFIVLNGTPENYEYWLASTIDAIGEDRESEHLVFINAWNEWAEGCHLEPDRWFGHRFLQATRNAKAGLRRYVAFPHVSTPAIEGEPLRIQSSETEALRDEIDAARAEIDMMREELDALYRSTSWRITAPLRGTRRLITRFADRPRPLSLARASLKHGTECYQTKLLADPQVSRQRIVHVIGNFLTGGSSRLVVDLFERLGHLYEQEVATQYNPDPPNYTGIPIHEFSGGDAQDKFIDYLRLYRPDLIHVHYWEDQQWYGTMIKATREFGCNVIQNINTPTAPYTDSCISRYIYVSDYVKNRFGKRDQPSITIYPGSNFKLFSRDKPQPVPDDCIGMVYRLDIDKLHKKSIDVFIKVVQKRPQTKVIIVGGGPYLEPYKAAVKAGKVEHAFTFTGFVPYENLIGFYARMSLFVAPVWKESFGQVGPFAMSMGLPVVGYNVGALAEIVGDRGLLVPRGNSEALAELITDLLDDKERREQIGSRNRARAHKLFSVENMIDDYLKLYQELMGNAQ